MKNFFRACLLRGTPSMVLALGAGFVMASSADIRAALGMGAAVLVSMLLTSIVVSAIHKFIPAYAKLPVYLLIIIKTRQDNIHPSEKFFKFLQTNVCFF